MKKIISIATIIILSFNSYVIAQENDNNIVSLYAINDYLKILGYNPIYHMDSVAFYNKQRGVLTSITINRSLGYLSIMEGIYKENDITNKREPLDFRPIGAHSMYLITNFTMMSSNLVKVCYNESDGSVDFVVEIPLMYMSEFKLHFQKCMDAMINAKKIFYSILENSLTQNKQ